MNDALPWIYGTDRNGERFDLRWARTVDAAVEPLTLQDAKDHLRYSQTGSRTTATRGRRSAPWAESRPTQESW
jgi:hypothetical protein